MLVERSAEKACLRGGKSLSRPSLLHFSNPNRPALHPDDV